jgi:uncharacterized BrkB/YihY/UPF0761 family membrane protein
MWLSPELTFITSLIGQGTIVAAIVWLIGSWIFNRYGR